MVIWIQILRATAALAVMFAHAHGLAGTYDISDYVPDFPIGAAGVDLFFVISGFVMVQASAKLFGAPKASIYFFLRRLARIAPIYWISNAVFLGGVYYTVGRDIGVADISVRNIFTSLIFIPDARPSGAVYPIHSLGWTLNFEMGFYVCFSAALFFKRRAAIVTLSILMVVWGEFLWMYPWPLPFKYYANPIILEFVFGMLIGWARLEGLRTPNWLGALLALAGLAWFAASAATFWLAWRRELCWGLPAAAMVAGGGLCQKDLTLETWPARFIFLVGDASYALYLFHPFSLVWPMQIFGSLLPPTEAPHLYYVLMICFAVSSAIAIHVWFERPITRYLQGKIASRIPTARAIPIQEPAFAQEPAVT